MSTDPSIEDEQEHVCVEHFDDETLVKVHQAITDQGFTDATAVDVISGIQNAGILFRERR